MRRSDNFIEVIQAINEAKQDIKSLRKDSTNPHFKNEYATIHKVLDVLKQPLFFHGITLNQFPDIVNDKFVLTTVLTHSSGSYIESDFPLILDKNNSQAQGSAITYARRYSLTAIFCLHEFDDDGNSASEEEDPKKDPKTDPKMPKPTVLSIMQKYIAKYKVDKVIEKNKLTNIHNVASEMMNIQNSETFISEQFRKTFSDQGQEKETT
jgi:hypothetical protein